MHGVGCQRWQISLIVLLSAFVLLGIAGHAAQGAEKNTALTSMIPLDSPAMISIDAPWVWKSSSDIRVIPEINKAIQTAEKTLDFSVEDDLLLWAGQTALVVTDIDATGPSFALFVQVRDEAKMIASPRLETLFQTIVPRQGKVSWLSMEYSGVAIRRAELPVDGAVIKLAIARLDNWLVITFGDGVIRNIIDTYHGDEPSIMKHPSFVRAMDVLPKDTVGQVIINGQGFLSLLKRRNIDSLLKVFDTKLGHFFLTGSVKETDTDILLDAMYCTTSPETQQVLKDLCTNAGVVTGASLTQTPTGAFATLLMHNPDKWIDAIETLILDLAGDEKTRTDMQQGFQSIAGIRSMLQSFSGELGINVAWRDDARFGVTLEGETASKDKATAAAAKITSFLKMQNIPVEQADVLASVPATKNNDKVFPILLCWKAQQQWLLAASHPDWLASQASPAPALPDIAKDAQLAGLGDISFLPAIVKILLWDNMKIIDPAILKMNFGHWACALKIAVDGGTVQYHAVLGKSMFSAMPVLASALVARAFFQAQANARQVESLSNLKQLSTMVIMIAQDHNDQFPVMATPEDIKQVLADLPTQLFISPRSKEPYKVNPSISGKPYRDFPHPDDIIMLYEHTPNADGLRCAAYMDGHVEVLSAKAWEAAKKKSGIP